MKLKLYMKSGNVIALWGITHWKVTNTGNTMTGIDLKWRRWPWLARPIVSSFDLSQIEAITQHHWF